jgi:hypothetical protein
MKSIRKRAPDSGDNSKAGRKRTDGGRHGNNRDTPSGGNPRRNKTKVADLPPNENFRKHADEIYGDTEIPERKRG